MVKQRRIASRTLVAITKANSLLLIATSSLFGATCRAPEEAFFAYEDPVSGKTVHLHLDSLYVAVRFSPFSEEEPDAIVQGIPGLSGTLSEETDTGYHQAFLDPGLTEEEILDLIATLNATPGIEWANPLVRLSSIFHDAYGYPLNHEGSPAVIDGRFFVEFEPEVEDEAILAFAQTHGLQGGARNENPLTGDPAGEERWYRFLLSEASSLNTLDLVELFAAEFPIRRIFPAYLPTAIF